MTYLKATEQGFIDAEKTIESATQEGLRAYRQAKIDINALLAKQYAKMSDITPDNYYNEMLKYDRLKKLNDEVSKVYKTASTYSGKQIKTGLQSGMTDNFYRQQFSASWLVDSVAMPVDPKLIEFATTGNVKYWAYIQATYGNAGAYAPQRGTLSHLLTKNYTAELDKILQSIESGLILEKSYTEVAKEISEVIGKYINSTGKSSGAMSNALNIARTEGQRILNDASLANAQGLLGQGFKVQKEWLSTLEVGGDHRHGALDGQRVDLDKDFVSPSGVRGKGPGRLSGGAGQNARCMCTTMTIIDDKGPETRVGINPNTGERDIISYTPYSEWIKQFSG